MESGDGKQKSTFTVPPKFYLPIVTLF